MAIQSAIPVEVVEVVCKTGIHGEVYQVMCKVLDGKDKGRVIRRTAKGPVTRGDRRTPRRTKRAPTPLGAFTL